MSKISESLKEIRKQKGISLEQLGQKIGLHRGNISRFESGKRELNCSTAELIADALDVEIIIKDK